MRNAVFTFTDIFNVKDHVILKIIETMPQKEIAIALIGESTEIRKRFYKNLPNLEDAHNLREEIKYSDREMTARIKIQEKMLALIATDPEYKNYRFQSRFPLFGDFTAYLTRRSENETPYGFAAQGTPSSSFFKSQNGEQALEEITQKNKAEGHESFCIPNTKIQLVNFSVCPECGQTYSFKALMLYNMNPKLDPAYKKGKDSQLRHDARMFCSKCKKYFLPTLLVVEEVPKNEVQFLGIMQTLNAIEDHFEALGYAVLSRNETNLLKSDGITTREFRDLKEDERNSFAAEVFAHENISPPSKILKGIRNDTFLKELESKPMLINNLLQYSNKPEIALNLIQGTNVEKNDVLFGKWR